MGGSAPVCFKYHKHQFLSLYHSLARLLPVLGAGCILTLSTGCTLSSESESNVQRLEVLSEVADPSELSSSTVVQVDAVPYTLGSGDQVYINVYGEKELSAEATIAENGKLSFPLLGELALEGLTVAEVGQLVAQGLRDGEYLVNPSVQVNITEYRPFFINGGVNRPGAYPFQPGLTVNKAVAIAQGFSRQSTSVKFYLLRQSDTDQQPLKVDSDSVIQPGDVITIRLGLF